MSDKPLENPPIVAGPAQCLNCDATLTGEYCAHCGQHSKHHVHSTPAMIAELIEDLFHTDHRVWRTLVPLMIRPGKLTVEYLRGKRVSYTPPFRLYIVLSLLFFLSASLRHDAIEIVPAKGGATYELDEKAKDKLDEFVQRLDADKREDTRQRLEEVLRQARPADQRRMVESMTNPCSSAALGQIAPMKEGSKLLDVCRKVTRDNGRSMTEAMWEHVPHMMFFFLPLIAVFGKLLYLGSRRYYAEHLLFFVHFHAFFFLAMAINNVIGWVFGWFTGAWAATAAGLSTTALVFYAPAYLYKAMRRVYGQGRFVTLAKFAVLVLCGYGFSAFLTFAVLAAYTAMTLK